MARNLSWRRPSLLEVWQHPEHSELIFWRTRRRGFKYELSFESVSAFEITVESTPTNQGLHLFFPAPTVVCAKRKELELIAAHYCDRLLESGYKRVFSYN